MITDSATIELGGIGISPVPDSTPIQTRHYRHPALPERTVVRLVRTNLAEVEDLSLAVMGFAPTGHADVGYVRNRAIGFPAWPIITDPANARHALNLVADLRRAAKLAKSKAGPAKELLDGLAATLGNSAPHFLPTFLEEGARIFLGAGNRTYAAQFFSKAREAERVHNLAVDEERHRQVLLEFALAGALSAKELTAESKALLTRHDPADALELFIELNIDRVKGGLPPYAQLSADLKRLVKAAKADQAATALRLLEAIISAPSLGRAPQAFWNDYDKALITLANRDPQVRDALLALTPDSIHPDSWMDVLQATGITDDLLAGRLDARAWAERYVRKLQTLWHPGYPRKLAQFVRQLPGLRGQHLQLDSRIHSLEPELLDALLAAGANVTFDRARWRRRLDFDAWLERDDRPDLPDLAASPHVEYAIDSIGKAVVEHLDILLAHPGMTRIVGMWADTRLPADPTPVQVHDEINRLAPLFTPAGMGAFPEQTAALQATLDPAELLATSLRDGLLTEYAWPALEQATAELAELGGQVTFHESWPAIGVACQGRIIWIEGDQRIAEAAFTPPKATNPEWWAYLLVDGVSVCKYRNDQWDDRFIWSNAPATEHEGKYLYRGARDRQTFGVPGGRLVGAHLARVGDAQDPFADRDPLISDGENYWTVNWEEIRQVDPETGKAGRVSLPTRLDDLIAPHLRDGWTLVHAALMWTPVTEHTAGSPLSTADGIHGWALLSREGALLMLGADGYCRQVDDSLRSFGRLAIPGAGHWLFDFDGDLHREANGERLLPARVQTGNNHPLCRVPRAGWHQFRVRDAAASARLRRLTAADVTDLLTATPALNSLDDREVTAEFGGAAAEAAARALLGSSDPVLVASVVHHAAWINRLVAVGRSLADVTAVPVGTFPQWEPSSQAIYWFTRDSDATSRADVHAMAARLAGENTPIRVLEDTIAVPLVRPEVLLACAARPLAEPAFIGQTAAAVASVLDAGLYRPDGCIFKFAHSWRSEFDASAGVVLDTPTGRAIGVGHDRSYSDASQAYFFSPDGALPPTVNDKPTSVHLTASAIEPATLIAAFEKLLAEGPPAWDPARVDRLATGLGWSRAAAAVLLAGLPGLRGYHSNYLPKPVRELLGLKVAEASAAREFLTGLDSIALLGLFSAGAADPMRVVTEGLDVDAMIEFWQAEFGSQILLPDDLLSAADKAFQYGGARHLRELADSPYETSLAVWLWAAARLPRTEELAGWLADRFDDLRENCKRPSSDWRDYEGSLRPLLGLPARDENTPKGQVQTVGAWTVTTANYADEVSWDPTKVTDWDAEAKLAEAIGDGTNFGTALRARLAVLSGAHDAIQADLRSGRPGAPQDPASSAPDVLAQVTEQLDLPEASARYWLQLLTLADPTDKNIDAWNQWRKTDRTKAAAPLLERGLIVEAKRARAGRTYFLPGGWQEASTPHLPMEVWKAPLYDLYDSPKVQPRQGVVVPLVPPPQLFADAWQRYRDGDVPGYTELRTQRYRRR